MMQKIIDAFEKEKQTLIRVELQMPICESLAQMAEKSAESLRSLYERLERESNAD